MKISFLVSLFVLTLSASGQSTTTWYKGNLHTHSYWSDGDEYPEMIMDWYKTHGYNFVALSDHNILAVGEKWIVVPKSKLYQQGFENYLKKYGENWVTHRLDSGRTHVRLKTFAEYKPLFETKDFLIIQSEEISDGFNGKPIHMNVTNVQKLIPPQGGQSVTDVMQRNLEAVMKQRTETGVPMIMHLNHPNFHFAVSTQDIIDLKGERFFEVYNGHPQVFNYGDSSHPGTEAMWDMINVAYSTKGQPLLYGLATDDSHNYHQYGAAYSNAGRGWVMVKAAALTPEALIEALESGQFYASTGVTLADLEVSNSIITVKVKADRDVTYTIEFVGVMEGETETRVFKSATGTVSSFNVTASHRFVRCRITSDKVKENPFHVGDYEMAWTQPVTNKSPRD
ncbi:MAG TPA: histidinol-phosphatase [Ohtaekwangia sp.]|nr:histidinol-phosphatase [Ohtaekwangia sp.]